jgi:hypothetical protein
MKDDDLLWSIATKLLRSDIRGVTVLFHNDFGKHLSPHLVNSLLIEKRKWFRDGNRGDTIVCRKSEVFHGIDSFRGLVRKMYFGIEKRTIVGGHRRVRHIIIGSICSV